VRVVVQRDEARQILLDGFFPHVALTDRPGKQQSGFREFGLPYASDPAVTRYLAAFLSTHRHAGSDRRGTAQDGSVPFFAGRGAGQGRGGAIRRGPTWCCSTAACSLRLRSGSV
jgi:hypothetical protein